MLVDCCLDRLLRRAMPTLLNTDGYRFYFYSHETGEPPHVHVDHAGRSAKFWLESLKPARNYGFSAVELRRIERIIAINRMNFLGRWNEFFGLNE